MEIFNSEKSDFHCDLGHLNQILTSLRSGRCVFTEAFI